MYPTKILGQYTGPTHNFAFANVTCYYICCQKTTKPVFLHGILGCNFFSVISFICGVGGGVLSVQQKSRAHT